MDFEPSKRIDKGIKRGPRLWQGKPTKMKRALEGQSWTIPDNLDPDEILAQYLVEPSTSGIAARYGIRRAALTRWIAKERPAQWKEVQVIRALCTKEDGTEGLYDAQSALHLARARELLRSAQWDLERLDSSNYGQKQEVNVSIDHKVSIEHSLADSALDLFKSIRSSTKTIESEPVRISDVMSNDQDKTGEGGV